MTSNRVIAAAALATLACLVAAAVALSPTSGTAPIVPSHLVVGSGPPTTVTGTLRYTDSSGISIDATLRVNVPARAAQLAATASLSIVSASATLRSVGDEVFLQLPGYTSLLGAPWTATRAPRDRGVLRAFADLLRRPRLGRLHPTSSTTRRHGTETTTTLEFTRVTVPALRGVPLELPRHGQLTLTVRTGPAGQVLSVALHLWNPNDDVRASFLVTGYDQPVTLAAPSPSSVKVLDRARATSIFGTNAPELFATLQELGVRLGAS